jgi:hypothetical protein
MQKDYRDVLEVVKFDLIEETVGSWLRAIIRRLEEEQTAIRRDQQKRPAPSHEADPPSGVHCVRHYWLCKRCSHVSLWCATKDTVSFPRCSGPNSPSQKLTRSCRPLSGRPVPCCLPLRLE